MYHTIEETQLLDSASRPALFFHLCDGVKVRGLENQNFNFGGRTLNGRHLIIDDLIPAGTPNVGQALKSAADGNQSRARFQIQRDGQLYYYELHCFPYGCQGEKTVSCFLLDRTSAQSDSSRLERKIYELDIISQAVRAFAETRNLSDILRIILLGVTAGPGLGFNRGFILLSNEARTSLWGCLATGPSTPEEAGAIWQDLARRSLSLEDILRLYRSGGHNVEDIHVNRLVATLRIPLSDDSNFIVKAVKEGKSIIAGPDETPDSGNSEPQASFGVDSMAVVPLISRETLQGVLLADNMITRKPITASDLTILEIFARYASDAIENSRLYGKLEQQICRLKEANDKIIRSRENLIRAEKLSSVAKMALDVAHEIRNPLTVIGGYANSHLRKIGPDDDSRKVLEIISRQTSRIETALNRFSSVVSLSEKKEGRFNLVNLVREALGMLSTSASPDLPVLAAGLEAEHLEVFVDQGLFNQAMMLILRKASQIAGSMPDIAVKVVKSDNNGSIFINGADNFPKFAEEFYRLLRDGRGELKYQEVAVALEILQHYGGGIGVLSDDKNMPQVYVHLPLCKEGS